MILLGSVVDVNGEDCFLKVMFLRLMLGFSLCIGLINGGQSAQSATLAILGDSIATGAATNPNLQYDSDLLWELFVGTKSLPFEGDVFRGTSWDFLADGAAEPPVNLRPTLWEFTNGIDWFVNNAIELLSDRVLNTNEYAWGYLLARRLGISPQEILMAARNGAKVSDIGNQLRRVLQETHGEVPPLLFIHMTGNDLCAPQWELTTTVAEYELALRAGFNFLLSKGKFTQKVRVVIPEFLNVAQLMYSEKILGKAIRIQGHDTTCREAREKRFQFAHSRPESPAGPWFFANAVPVSPFLQCTSIFSPLGGDSTKSGELASSSGVGVRAVDISPEGRDRIAEVANRTRSFRDVMNQVVVDMNQKATLLNLPVSFEIVRNLNSILFEADEIAGDCFHLSSKGQIRLAESIWPAVNSAQ